MRSLLRFSIAPVLVLLTSCGGAPVAEGPKAPAVRSATTPPSGPRTHAAPTLRLPTTAKPTAYAVTMRMSPSEEAFQGTVDVALALTESSDTIWLHAGDNLRVTKASLDGAVAAKIEREGDFLGLVFASSVPAGPHKLALAYDGKLPSREGRGAYRQEEKGEQYIFTQFESTDARRAFPCFDEPSFKVPFAVTLEVPERSLAFSNAPQVSERPIANGWKSVSFAETKPLPSYLVAFAVGPFEIVDAGKAGEKKIPVRIIVPKGRSAEAKYAAETTGQVVERLEKYFGMPYPYEKLDHIAVPQKGGAMENPGLITYGTGTILGKPEDKSIRLQRGYLSIAAHELGHIWFGDLVTTAWWDDIWLNEAFATWISAKIVDQWHPEWDGAVRRVESKAGVMGGDAYASARKIRQPIESKHDIANAFDGITYQKGAAVITMFESLVSEASFRNAVRAYLQKHAHGNATSAEFLTEIGQHLASENVAYAAEVPGAFRSFLDQAGVPLVTADLVCTPGKTPELLLSQERYVPRGAEIKGEQSWQIPICASFPGGRSCSIMKETRATLPLTGATSCPAWVDTNANAAGYYRVAYKGDLLRRLLANGGKALAVHERMAVFSDAIALARRGDLPEAEVLALVPGFVKDGDRHLVGMTVGLVSGLEGALVKGELRPSYERFIAKQYGARARALGWTPKPNEDDGTRLLRPGLVALAAKDASSPLAKDARKLLEAWLVDRKAIDHDLVGTVLAVGARDGDRALWDKLHAAAIAADDRKDRGHLLSAMAAFRDPKIVEENFKVALGDKLDPRESFVLVSGGAGHTATRQMAYDFVTTNYDRLVARMPREWGAGLPGVFGGFCDDEHRKELEAFFKDKADQFNGGPRSLAQTLEGIRLCTAHKDAQEASVASFLRAY